jgi:hypothetical protein
MIKRVRFFVDYLVKGETEDEILSQADKDFQEDVDNGYVDFDYEIMDEEGWD